MLRLSDKIVALRKSRGMSQEELSEKLNVSRQAVSRWEMGTAMPDTANILQLSKLFHVTTDYLLNDEYRSDNDLPKVKEVKNDDVHLIMICLVTLEIMILLMQFITIIILQSCFFGILACIPFVAVIGGFEYAYRKKISESNEQTTLFRKRFYKISVWLGTYFPLRFVVTSLMKLYPRPYQSIVLDCIILAIYILAAALLSWEIDRRHL